MNRSTTMPAALLAAALAVPVTAGITMPNEFESADQSLGPMFAYFGGVTAWGSQLSTTTIHSGNSLEVWANLQADAFTVSGFAVGTFGISGPDLAVDPAADTFSLTIQPPSNGQMSFYLVVREDDNGDDIINAGEDDDQWETSTYMLEPGTFVYNLAFSEFLDLDPSVGNNVQNFTTTGAMSYFIVFETSEGYPGGRITEPVSLLVDHMGFYVGPQSLPGGNPIPGDATGDGIVNFADILQVISDWGSCPGCPSDFDGDGVVGFNEILTIIGNWTV
ncbi:MAG: hypothetical protein ACYTGP_01095 [Planctomycetota bacterium]|jgi:hypothetical protein